MKFSPLLFLYAAFLAGPAMAAPVPSDLANELDRRMDPPPPPKAPSGPFSRLSQYASAKVIGMKINRKFKPKQDEAIFWAGRLPHPTDPKSSISMEGHARGVALANSKSTLEDHLDRHKIKIPDASKNRHSAKLWEKASKTFANRAHGETHAYLGSYVRPKSVYTTMEKPILMANPRITKITEHRVHTGTREVVKGRKSPSLSRSASHSRSMSGAKAAAARAGSRSRSASPAGSPSRGRTMSRGNSASRSRSGSPSVSRGRSLNPVHSRPNSPSRSKSPAPKRKP